MQSLIGLTGFAQCGKSSAAKFLRHKHFFHEDSFAEPIRQFVCEVMGFNRDALEYYKEKHITGFTHTPREMMQTLGTEWGREMMQDDLWIRSLKNRLLNFQHPRVVISDVRFENEAAMIRGIGGEIWHIKRKGHVPAHDHASERGVRILPIDKVINNNGTLADLYKTIEVALGVRGA